MFSVWAPRPTASLATVPAPALWAVAGVAILFFIKCIIMSFLAFLPSCLLAFQFVTVVSFAFGAAFSLFCLSCHPDSLYGCRSHVYPLTFIYADTFETSKHHIEFAFTQVWGITEWVRTVHSNKQCDVSFVQWMQCDATRFVFVHGNERISRGATLYSISSTVICT